MSKKITVGILGYGSLGKYLSDQIQHDPVLSQQYQLAFVWNRSVEKLEADVDNLAPQYWLTGDLQSAFRHYIKDHPKVDMIIEVSHPNIVAELGAMFLQHSDFVVGSPTAFANQAVEDTIRGAAKHNAWGHGCYVPAGAFWGVQDIVKMNELAVLDGLTVSMTKPPHSFKLQEPLASKLAAYEADDTHTDPLVIFEGPVRQLCPLAPNNVNTMACAALAGESLGFDDTQARLVADKSLEAHIVGIEARDSSGFVVNTQRYNPCQKNAVTGNATYGSFLSSFKRVGGQGNGFFFC